MSEKKKENLEEMFKDLEELIGKMENVLKIKERKQLHLQFLRYSAKV